jgi:hypothetical protein
MNSRRWHLNKDYPTLERWFKLYKWDSPIPKNILPELGIIIEDVCAAGLYTDKSSKLGYMYGIFSNPQIPKIKLFKSMLLCLNEIKILAKELNLNFIYTTTAESSLHKLYTKILKINNCESNLKAYIIDLNNSNINLDWISENKEIKNGNR